MPVLDPLRYRGEPPRANILREQRIERRRRERAETEQAQTEQDRAEFESIHAKPGAGDQWVKKADYDQLTRAQRSAYDKGGMDALNKVVTTTSPRGISAASQLPRGLLTPDIADDWKQYVEDTDQPTYKIAEHLISKGAPEAVVYAYIQQHPDAERGATVSKYVTNLNEQLGTYNDLPDKGQYDLLVKLGFIPEGSSYIPGVTQSDIEKMRVGMEPGLAKEVSTIKPSVWSFATPEQRAQASEQAMAGVNFRKAMNPYKVIGGYDLVSAINGGLTPAQLKKFRFDPKAIAEAQSIIRQRDKLLSQIEPYKVEGGYDLVSALAGGVSVSTLRDLKFSEDDIANAEATLQIPEEPKRVKTLAELGIVSIQPLLSPDAQYRYELLTRAGHEWEHPEFVTEYEVNKEWDSLNDEMRLAFIQGSPEYRRQLRDLVIAATPVLGTVYYWRNMSTVERGLSIGLDVVFLGTALFGSKIVAAAKNINTRYLTPAEKLDKIYETNLAAMRTALRNVNPGLVEPFENLTEAQRAYAQQLAKVNNMKAGLETVRGEFLTELKTNLSAEQSMLNTRQNNFMQAAERYATELRSTGVPLDSPLLQGSIDRLPKDILRQTNQAVAAVSGEGANLKDLQTQLARITTELQEAQQKWPTNPAKWTDLAQEKLTLQAQISAVQSGSILELQERLVTARAAIPELEKLLAEARRVNSPFSNDLQQEMARAKQLVNELPDQIDAAIKAMEVEYGRGGNLSRGIVTATTPTDITGTGGGVTIISPLKGVIPIVAGIPLRSGQGSEADLKPYIQPDVIAIPGETPDVRVTSSPGEEPEIEPEPEPGTEPGTERQTEPGTAGQTSTTTEPGTEPGGATSPATEPSPVTGTPTETGTPTKTPPPDDGGKKKPFIRLPLPSAEAREEDWLTVPDGTVVWKQGFGYWQVRPPYGHGDKHFTIKKPEGAKIHSDMRSAAASLQTLSGKPPDYFGFNMGVVDVTVKTPPRSPDIGAGRSSIKFTRKTGASNFGPYKVVRGGNTIGLKRRRKRRS